MTKASEELSASTSRRSGITTLSTSACVSIPNGPSARVEHTISGPFANRSGSSAASRPRVTSSLQFGLTTRMRRWDAVIPVLAPGSKVVAHHRGVQIALQAAHCSISRSTAGEIEHRAGAERTFFGRQPDHERGDLLRFSQSPQRDLRKHVVDMGLRHLREQWCSYGGGRDTIHPDCRVGQLFAERFCKSDHGSFAGAICRRVRIAVLARNRSNVDDPTVVSIAHERRNCPATVERSLHVDGEDSLPVVDRILPQPGVRTADTRAIYEYVDGRDDPERLLDGTHHRTQVADVDGNARSAQLLHGSPCRLRVEVPNHDLGTRRNQARCNGESQPRRATGHYGIAAVKIQFVHCLPSLGSPAA